MSPAGFFHYKMHSVHYCNIKIPTPPPDLFWVSSPDLFWRQYSVPAYNRVNLPSAYFCTLSLQGGFSCFFLLRQPKFFYALFCLFISRVLTPKLTIDSYQPSGQQWKQSGHLPGQHRLYNGNNFKQLWTKNDKTTNTKTWDFYLICFSWP